MTTFTETFNPYTSCDQPAALTNFSGAAYMGAWFEQQRSQNFEPNDLTCIEAQYSNLTADGHFSIQNTS